MFQVCGAFAEFERSMIRHRVRAGLARAVKDGKRLGRPKIDANVEKRILTQLRTGKGILSVARQFKVGTGTVQRIAREMGGDRPFATPPQKASVATLPTSACGLRGRRNQDQGPWLLGDRQGVPVRFTGPAARARLDKC